MKPEDKSSFNQPIRICAVAVNDQNEFVFEVENSNGLLDTSAMEFIYRMGAGIYWDEKSSGFYSTKIKSDKDVVDWSKHFVKTLSNFGLKLELCNDLRWERISKCEQGRILVAFSEFDLLSR